MLPAAQKAYTALTDLPLSPDVMDSTCFLPFNVTIAEETCTVVHTDSSILEMCFVSK